MTLEQIVRALQDRNLTLVSEATGLQYQTVRNIARGITTNPSYVVCKKLEKYIAEGSVNA